jgi:hypothetical protein
MPKPDELHNLTDLAGRLGAFIAERYPFALPDVLAAFEASGGGLAATGEAGIEALRPVFRRELARCLQARPLTTDLSEPSPRTSAEMRVGQARGDLVDACDGFLRRAAIEASLTTDERVEILRGMMLTRATDNRLKTLFTSGEVQYRDAPFQGKGFRSLGQERPRHRSERSRSVVSRSGGDRRGSSPPGD